MTVDVHVDGGDGRAALERDVRAGLTAEPKALPPIWFYDDRGSALFDQITRLPEYYPTRAEREILEDRAKDVVAAAEADTLVELGSGTSEKTRLLLDALTAAGRARWFVPFDVSDATLLEAAAAVAGEYPGLAVHAVVGDFQRHLGCIPRYGRRLVAFLGGTIGNLAPASRRRFLFDVDAALDSTDSLLLGTDLVKDPARLVAAYDDASGVTAEFNLNLLRRLNRQLGADFDLARFEHVAVWNPVEQWMEMRLRARSAQDVHISSLDLDVHFAAGEEMLTEISAKFTEERITAELWDAGLVVEQSWTDDAGDFLVTLSRPYC